MKSKYLSAAAALLCAAGLAACGGKGNGSMNLGVQVFGLDRTGLVLQNNGGDDLTVAGTGNAFFATLLAPDASFNVTVKTQPDGVVCTPANNTGKINIYTYLQTTVTCVPVPYILGGKINGLNGTGLVLNNGSVTVSVPQGATTWQFTDPVGNGSVYGVTVLAPPTRVDPNTGATITQDCTVANGTGKMPQYNLPDPRTLDIVVTCVK
ncbi:hypothetical protein GM658_17550 [Pseudoduganella eburnea]|uniref:Lipoprotein n=1 Tax=Massilia eburnea TaxID=1776165 RepID=A0A6L6QL60_9BURK|nr:hypothetical protein [Massilia eburnea]MTW12416.1 hypothetical protein [Massilia eburnea]